MIIDGQLIEKNLTLLGKDEVWLKLQLHSQGAGGVKDVFLAVNA